MYGTILCFDDSTEKQIDWIWSQLAEANISFYHIEKNGKKKRPHVTLADYGELNLDAFKDKFLSFFSKRTSFALDFSTLGCFSSARTLFLAPVMTEDLWRLHMDYHRFFGEFCDIENSYYLPGKWVPHCTLANHLPHKDFLKAFDFIARDFKPIKAQLSEVVLIKIEYNNGEAVGSTPIIHYRF